jgi:hypothetical protein
LSAGLIASAPESASISTWPSCGAFATMLAATTPPAPGTFSTTNGLPSVSANFAASRRPSTSGLPPGPAGAITRTARFGNGSDCAKAGPGSAIASANEKTAEVQRMPLPPCCATIGGAARCC